MRGQIPVHETNNTPYHLAHIATSFQLVADLYGGNKKAIEFLSIYLCNVSNDFDIILKWPVKFKFELILSHPWVDKKHSCTHCFVKGDARGFRRFLSCGELPGYIQDNSLFITCYVKPV